MEAYQVGRYRINQELVRILLLTAAVDFIYGLYNPAALGSFAIIPITLTVVPLLEWWWAGYRKPDRYRRLAFSVGISAAAMLVVSVPAVLLARLIHAAVYHFA